MSNYFTRGRDTETEHETDHRDAMTPGDVAGEIDDAVRDDEVLDDALVDSHVDRVTIELIIEQLYRDVCALRSYSDRDPDPDPIEGAADGIETAISTIAQYLDVGIETFPEDLEAVVLWDERHDAESSFFMPIPISRHDVDEPSDLDDLLPGSDADVVDESFDGHTDTYTYTYDDGDLIVIDENGEIERVTETETETETDDSDVIESWDRSLDERSTGLVDYEPSPYRGDES